MNRDDRYPNSQGFQSHSETSAAGAEAVEANGTKVKLYDFIISSLTHAGEYGATNNELAINARQLLRRPNLQNGTMGARLCELEMQGRIIKTQTKRLNPDTKVEAFVYVLGTPGTATATAKGRRNKRALMQAWDSLKKVAREQNDMLLNAAINNFETELLK